MPLHSPIYLGGILSAALFLINYPAGAFDGGNLPSGYISHLQLFGHVIMCALLAPYIVNCVGYSRHDRINIAD
jgi:hypothetical protein